MSNTKLFLRLENAENTDAVDTADVLAADTDAKVDAEAITEAAAHVTETDLGIDNAMEAADEVSAASATMEEAVADGEGLTPREAEMVEARLERAAALLGADLSALGLTFRRESFGGKESRLAVTKMRLEAAEGFGKKIWEGLKKAWQWLKDAVIALVGKLTKSADSLEKRLKTLESQASQVKGKAKEAKLKTQAKTFSVEGKTSVDTILSFGKNVESFAVALDSLKSFSVDLSKVSGTPGAELLRSDFKSQEKISAKGEFKDAEAYGRLPGGRAVVVRFSKKSMGGQEVQISTLTVEQIDSELASEYDAPDQKALSAIVATGLSVTRALKTLKTTEDATKKVIDATVTYIDKMASAGQSSADSAEGADKAKNKETADALREVIKSNHSQLKVLIGTVPNSFFAIGSGMADVVAAGISNFKEEKAAA